MNQNTKTHTAPRGAACHGNAARRRRSRYGSVLILVVALLVLMALIGTAWISTARVDRAAAVQHGSNTQVDLLVDGVTNMAVARLVADTSEAGKFRHWTGYNHFDDAQYDDFMASRVPVLRDEIAPQWQGGPRYPGDSHPTYFRGRLVRMGGTSGRFYLCRQTHRADPGQQPGGSAYWEEIGTFDNGAPFDSGNPPVWPAVSRILPPDTKFSDIQGGAPDFTDRTGMSTVTKLVNGRYFPAFEFYPEFRRDDAPPAQILAADTDGDGIADANYFKLPVGRLNGLDYYAAIRIVDNNSAVNASTALGNLDPGVAGFPSSINFMTPFNTRRVPAIQGPTAAIVTQQHFDLNRARFNEITADDRSATDFRFAPFDDAYPINDLSTGNLQDRRREDFVYSNVEELFYTQFVRRMANPGYWTEANSNALLRMKALAPSEMAALAYRGGTLINPDAMNVDLTASSQIEQILYASLYYCVPNHPNVGNTMARRPSYAPAQYMWRDWFGQNYDYRELWTQEDYGTLATYRNRRPLISLAGSTSNAVIGRYNAEGDWDAGNSYDIGDYVTHFMNGSRQLFFATGPVLPGTNIEPGDPIPTGFDPANPRRAQVWEPRVFSAVPTKASAMAGTFGELLLAYWHVMAESATLLTPDARVQTPFKDAWRAEIFAAEQQNRPALPNLLDSPYRGGRFTAAVLPTPPPLPNTFAPYTDPLIGPTPDQHSLRMFRSPIRWMPAAGAAAPFLPTTPRMMVDHTMRLRAALAAVNTIDMRDNDDDVTVREITVGVTLNRGAGALNELDDVNAYARARVYGHEKQPFITEIYANNDNTSNGPGGAGAPNATGYVAVELHNPYPFPINIRYCRLATIDRTAGAPPFTLTVVDPGSATAGAASAFAPDLFNATSNLAGPATSPWLIPANGYLVLENYDAVGSAAPRNGHVAPAMYRPAATGLAPTGAITPPAGDLVRNHAYVPNLHTVMDKEMVLLRPVSTVGPAGDPLARSDLLGSTLPPSEVLTYAPPAGVAAAAIIAADMAPLDSYDFTGLPNPDPLVNAPRGTRATPRPGGSVTHHYAWHYARASNPTTKAWRFVYPGRYDAHQSVPAAAGGPARPRHQGTYEATGPDFTAAGWDENGGGTTVPMTDPWDVTQAGGVPPVRRITLAEPAYLADPRYGPMRGTAESDNATYFPYEYPIQLTNVTLPNAGSVGPFPLAYSALNGLPNQYPFGGFARNGDILQVPYMGSYRLKLTGYGALPLPGQTNAPRQAGPNHFTVPGNILELNAITMDSVFAEDTDPVNHAINGGVSAPPEQIGRFTPTLADLEVHGVGIDIDDASPAGAFPAYIRDAERREASGFWVGYEIVITDGPGKGQVRTVTSWDGTRMEVFPPWESNVFVQGIPTRYTMRKGTMWRQPTGRSAGNKAWATDLFDYLTIDTPQNDHFPMADPSYVGMSNGDPLAPQSVHNTDPRLPGFISYARKLGGGASRTRFPATLNLLDGEGIYINGLVQFVTGPLALTGEVRIITGYDGPGRIVEVDRAFSVPPNENDIFRIIYNTAEDLTPVHGLININTAPAKVLEMLPMLPDVNANRLLALEIARHRDGDPSAGIVGHGPFRTMFDLYRVPAFELAQRTILSAGDPGQRQGDWTPFDAGPDNVRFDFEEQFLLLNRISNMITTRSDSFTVYVLVQGWRGGGTQNPELVVERRRAFIADRNGLSATNKDIPLQFLYND